VGAADGVLVGAGEYVGLYVVGEKVGASVGLPSAGEGLTVGCPEGRPVG